MSPAYFVVLGVIVVGLMIGLEVYRRGLRTGEDQSLKESLQGKLFSCVLLQGGGVGLLDVAMGGVVGASGLAAIKFGAFREGRAFLQDGQFIVDTIDPNNVGKRMDMMRIRVDSIRRVAIRPYEVRTQLRRVALTGAVVGASLGVLVTLIVLFKVGFDNPRVWLVGVLGIAFGLVMGLVFGVLPSLMRMRSGRWLFDLYGDADALHGQIAVEQQHVDEAAAILSSLGVPLDRSNT